MKRKPESRMSFALCLLLLAGITAACSSVSDAASDTSLSQPDDSAGGAGSTPAPAKSKKPATKGGQVRIAFGGDVHFAGSSAGALNGDVGSAVSVLKAADLAVVNLETAITTRGTAAPKEFTFRAPPTGMFALRKAGIDVVTVANNHGMDYGRVGLADTLAAGKSSGLAVIGAGTNVTNAFTPYTRTINGVRVSVLAATDVLDAFATNTWPATETTSGLASAKDPELLLAAVRKAADDSDVVAVVLHWGVELQSCPSQRQQELARELTDAGADIVVGSHAHVLEPHVRQGNAAINYGLGNFIFYATKAVSTQSGVYSVVVDRKGVVKTAWKPAQISSGRPQLLTGSAAEAASARENALVDQCGLE
jgi:poly-gamma-glutamate capsule biosynthesis protein CapA/YwtB (metallophosphatase superfamily)